jgi:4-aminobutyrate aminotransferase-like enzyme
MCLEGGYHGISKATMDISAYKWNEHYPKPDHVTVAKSPCTYRGEFKDEPNSKRYADYIRSITKEDTGAFLCELMQSCAGQVIPPRDHYKEVYAALKEKGVVTIGDEVQTGFGRLGCNFWAFEYYGIIPDIVTCGKAMGNGFPVSAVICKKEIAEAFKKRNI